eukprot:TRINITY_DN34165_c0_g1_i1.p1 TRINITY_DN34165_c0_g1~~TRINITY_DN34165_c0_g1_i1.p1  ORF type:complete len:135 (+),score=12.07 TRINITY_DN34165_c0_g1_i1:61-465(+)
MASIDLSAARLDWCHKKLTERHAASAHVSFNPQTDTYKLTVKIWPSRTMRVNSAVVRSLGCIRSLCVTHICSDRGHTDSRGTSCSVFYLRYREPPDATSTGDEDADEHMPDDMDPHGDDGVDNSPSEPEDNRSL